MEMASEVFAKVPSSPLKGPSNPALKKSPVLGKRGPPPRLAPRIMPQISPQDNATLGKKEKRKEKGEERIVTPKFPKFQIFLTSSTPLLL